MSSPIRDHFGAPPQGFGLGVYLVVVVGVVLGTLLWAFPRTGGLLADDQPPDRVAVDGSREVVAAVDTTGGALGSLNRAAGSVDTSGAASADSALAAGPDSVASPNVVAADLVTIGTPPPKEVPSRRMLVLVILVGALGASLHGLTSLVEFVGNGKFVASWTLWYLARPVVGALLALVFYFVSRGLVDVVDTKDEFYGVLAVAGVVGLFSKQALYKMSEVFDVIFKSGKDDNLKDKLTSSGGPAITRTAPASFTVGAAERQLQVTGTGFVAGSEIQIGTRALETTLKNSTTLAATLDEADLAEPGELGITVANPGPSGGTSAPFRVAVEPAAGPDPPAPVPPVDSDPATGTVDDTDADSETATGSAEDSDVDTATGSVDATGTVDDANADSGTGTPGPTASTSAPPAG